MLHRIRNRAQEQGGFTLIELLVVILIIGILAAIAIPTFLNQRGKAQDAGVKSDIRNAATAEETYYTDNQHYTITSTDLTGIEPTLTPDFSATLPSYVSTAMTLHGNAGVDTDLTGYQIALKSQSGVTYTYARGANGTVNRTCSVPSTAGSAAGCAGATVPASGTSPGTW